MDIRMPIRFHGNYVLTIRSGDKQTLERCQKLTIKELSKEEKRESTHLITFYDFGCKRVIEGQLKENEEEKVSFLVEDKEYEFSPFKPSPR